MIDFLLDISPDRKTDSLPKLFNRTPVIELHHNNETYELMIWGDPIVGGGFLNKAAARIDPGLILSNVYGHYYYLLLDKKNGDLVIGNSVFSLLPIYYSEAGGRLVFSNNAIDIARYLGLSSVSRRLILESMLFNYPLFNHSIVDTVRLLPSNSFMLISPGTFRVEKHTRIEDYFTGEPLPWRNSTSRLSDLFLETVKKYLPSERYVNSLTGGLDSRTLAAAGLYYRKDFICSSFGVSGTKDVEIPEQISVKTGISYLKIPLDKEYAERESLINGWEFVRNSSGVASFVRAHYLYAAKILAQQSRYMITGNFGSELFRAAHVRGVVFSPNLISLFSLGNPDDGLRKIENSPEFRILQKENFTGEWDQLKQDLHTLPCYSNNYKHLTQNQKFYVFVFEEVFRKYFGAELANQFLYLKNRTPYLDLDFLKVFLKTGLSGVYSDFFEHNPFKRYKGQVLYAHILGKAFPSLGEIVTDKGYRPADLLGMTGQFNIVRGYLKKRNKKLKLSGDPYAVDRSYRHNRDFYRQIPIDDEYFNLGAFPGDSIDRPGGQLYKVISLSGIRYAIKGNTGQPLLMDLLR